MRSFRVSFHNPRPPSVFSGDSSGKHSGRQASESNKGIKKSGTPCKSRDSARAKFLEKNLGIPEKIPECCDYVSFNEVKAMI